MKKHFTLFFLVLFFLSSINAQRIEGVAGSLKFGYMHAPSSGNTLNKIAPAGITGFDDNYFTFGAEAYYRKFKNIYTVEGTVVGQGRYANNTAYAEPYCGAAHGKWGRIVAENDHSWLYPSIGAGASFLQLTTYEKANGKVVNIQEKTLVSPSFDVGINADFLLSKINYKEGYYFGWILGIRAGYRASFSSDNWKDEQVVKPYDKPRYANNAFYFTVTIGGGSFNRKE